MQCPRKVTRSSATRLVVRDYAGESKGAEVDTVLFEIVFALKDRLKPFNNQGVGKTRITH